MPEQAEAKEVYGDPIKFRLGSEFVRITDDLLPRVLGGVDYIRENRSIDDAWRATVDELGALTIELKFAVVGFKTLLTKDDADSIRTFDACLAQIMAMPARPVIQHGQMEGRAEMFAKRAQGLEDRALALYFQVLDVRSVAYRNKMWDLSHRPDKTSHGVKLT